MSCDMGIESLEDIIMGRMGSCQAGWGRGESRGVLGEGLRDSYPSGWEQNWEKIWQIIGPYLQEKKMLVCPVFSCWLLLT